MPEVVQLTAPRTAVLVPCPAEPLAPGQVRVRTWYSGISAGTELTAYRGTNPYLSMRWDAARRLFVEGTPTFDYPVTGWGYQEVGEVSEVAPDVTAPTPGDVVYGIWGHRSEAVLPAATLVGQRLPPGVPPLHGVFARVGAIALNAVLAAEPHLGERVAVFGQGVIGLLATRLAVLSGAEVLAVDAVPARRELAARFGAATVLPADAAGGAGAAVRDHTGGVGVDVAIELSGSYPALHEATRSVAVDGVVVAAGFYQGEGVGLRLGEEFHHNRVRLVASQVGGTPTGLGVRWNHARLLTVFMTQLATGAVDVAPLVSHVVASEDVGPAFRLLDESPAEVRQVVLRFPAAPS